MMDHMWGYGPGGLFALLVVAFLVLGVAAMVKYLLGERKPPGD